MLSEALQRNAKHEARLSNISCYCRGERIDGMSLRFFASLRMTNCGTYNKEAICQCDGRTRISTRRIDD
jgi:hypothetical protein